MVAQTPGARGRVEFKLTQLAKVEFLGHGATALIAIADAVEVPDSRTKLPLLVTGIPGDCASSLMPAKLAAGDAVISCTVMLAAPPRRESGDAFFTGTYGGRLVMEG